VAAVNVIANDPDLVFASCLTTWDAPNDLKRAVDIALRIRASALIGRGEMETGVQVIDELIGAAHARRKKYGGIVTAPC